jgi:hypothetical protein
MRTPDSRNVQEHERVVPTSADGRSSHADQGSWSQTELKASVISHVLTAFVNKEFDRMARQTVLWEPRPMPEDWRTTPEFYGATRLRARSL